MASVDMLSAPRSRRYKVKHADYDNVVNGHPRYSVWVEPQADGVDQTGTVSGRIYIKNLITGEGTRIFGINHWYWQDHRFCIFPVYHSDEMTPEVKTIVERILAPGAEVELACTRESLPVILKVTRRRPNFLFILTDEQRKLPYYENASVRKWYDENLKSFHMLREHGIEFNRHYVGATACNPSRTTLFTGQYPSLHGVSQTDGLAKPVYDQNMSWLDPSTVPTMGDYFKAGGYRTYYKGKWHVSEADIVIPGTRLSLPSTKDGKMIDRNQEIYENSNRLAGYGFSGWVGPEPHGPSKQNSGYFRDEPFAMQTVDLLKQLDEEWRDGNTQPFFTVCSFVNPHDICLWGIPWFNFKLPSKDDSMDGVDFDYPPTFIEDLSTKPICQLDYRNNWAANFLAQPPNLEYIKFYYYLQKIVDLHIQEVLNTIKNCAFFEDTIIIRTSDHGDLLGSHGGMHQKWHNAYEETLHVDMLISNPKLVPQHKEVNHITSHLDLLPTFLGLAGLNQAELGEKLKKRKSEVQPPVGHDFSSYVTHGAEDCFDDAALFVTDDEVETGSRDKNPFGLSRKPPRLPSHLQTLITYIDNEVWKITRYHDPTPHRPMKRESSRSFLPEYVTLGGQSYHLEPALDEWEVYNLNQDPSEATNLGHPSAVLNDHQRSTIEVLKKKLEEHVHRKLLEPAPYFIEPPPATDVTPLYTKMLKSLKKGRGWLDAKPTPQ